MSGKLPSSILFCCDHNSVRSPAAEGIMKKYYGHLTYVQSAGVKGEREIDGFCVAVCKEIGVEIFRHQSRSFDEISQKGEDISAFDLIIALSPASRHRALELTRHYHLDIEYWSVLDPVGIGETREEKLSIYRKTRDQIMIKMTERFGRPTQMNDIY